MNDVGPFSRFYDPPPFPLINFLLLIKSAIFDPTLPPPLRIRRLWMTLTKFFARTKMQAMRGIDVLPFEKGGRGTIMAALD